MTPLQKIAMGLVIVIIDPDIAGYDAVPDVLGWLLVVLGLIDLRERLSGFAALVVLAVVSGGVSLLLLLPSAMGALDESTGWYLSLPYLVFCIVLCGSVASLIAQGEATYARRFAMLRWVFVVLVPMPALLYGGGLDALRVLVAIVGLVAVAANIYLVYLLFRVANTPPAARSEDVRQARRSG